MPCGCMGKSKKYAYEYINPTTGERKTYNTEVEARAAQIRNKGGSYTAVEATR